MNRSFWKDKRVLVTGHEGFLGANLTRRLLGYGARIVGIDIAVRRKQTLYSPAEYRNITTVAADVADLAKMKKTLARYAIDTIFHLAAEAIVEKATAEPVRTFRSNIEGTWNVLECARSHGRIERVVIASSDKAYGAHAVLPYTEAASLRGNHPYDVSKSCADLIAATYAHTYGVPVAVTRCGNIFGPGDFNFSRIIPDAMRSIWHDRPLLIRSDGKFTRDYVYVDDIVNGYLTLAEHLQRDRLPGEAFNFSNENPVTVLELVRQLYTITGRRPRFRVLATAKYEIKHQYLNARKARRLLRWKPGYSLAAGLKLTWAWYARFFKTQCAHESR